MTSMFPKRLVNLVSIAILAFSASLPAIGATGAGGAQTPPNTDVLLEQGRTPVQTALTVSSWAPPGHILYEVQVQWCASLEALTQRRIRCDVLSPAVAPAHQSFDAIRGAMADMTVGIHGATPEQFLLTRLAELPLGGLTAERNSVAFQRIYDKYLVKHDEHRKLKVLSVFTGQPGQIFNARQAIRSRADLVDLRLRHGGGMAGRVAKALNIREVSLPAHLAGLAVADQQLDGVMFNAAAIERLGLSNAFQHRTAVPGGFYNASYALVINREIWRRLPKQDRQAISKLSGVVGARLFGRAIDKMEQLANDQLAKQGVKVDPQARALAKELKKPLALLDRQWIAAAKRRGLRRPKRVLQEFRRFARSNPRHHHAKKRSSAARSTKTIKATGKPEPKPKH